MVDILRRATESSEPYVITALAQRWSGRFSHSAANAATVCSPSPIAPRGSTRVNANFWIMPDRPSPRSPWAAGRAMNCRVAPGCGWDDVCSHRGAGPGSMVSGLGRAELVSKTYRPDWQRPRPKTQSKSIRRRDTPRLGPTPVRYCIPHRMHPRNASSTLPNQSRSAKPAGTITSSPSPTDFRTPPPPPSNLHSARQPSYPTSRAFLHWRLSDDGPGASRIVSIGCPDIADQAGHVGFVPIPD